MGDSMNLEILLKGTNEAVAPIEEVNTVIDNLVKSTDTLTTSFDNLVKAIDSISSCIAPLEELSAPILSATTDADNLTRSIKDIAQTVSSEIEPITSTLGEIANPLSECETAASNLSEQITKVGTSAEEASRIASESLGGILAPINENDSAIKTMTEQMQTFAEETEGSMARAEQALAQMRLAGAGGVVGSESSGESSRSSGTSEGGGGEAVPVAGGGGKADALMQAIGLQMATQPLVDFTKKSIEAGAAYDQAMRNVNTESKLPEEQFQKLKDKVVDLSQTVPKSAEDLAGGLYKIYGASVPASKSFDVLNVAAKGAVAGVSDTNTSVMGLTTTMRSYGEPWDNAQKVMDKFFTTVTQGDTTYDQLAQNIQTVAGSAHGAGVTMDELLASYASLVGVSGNTAEVTTQLSGIFKEVMKPSAGVVKAANDMGLNFSAAELKSKGFIGFLKEIQEKTGGSEEKLAKLFPNVRGLRGALALATTQSGEFSEKLNAIQHSSDGAGAATNAYNEAVKGQSNQFEIFSNHLFKIGNDLDKIFKPAIDGVLGSLEKLMGWFDKHPKIKEFAEATMGVAAALSAVAIPLAIISALVDPWVIGIGLLVATVIGLGIVIYNNWDDIKKWTEEKFGAVFQKTSEIWGKIKSTIKEAWDYISPTIMNAVKDIKKFWDEVWPKIKELFSNVWNDIVNNPVILLLKTVISAQLDLIKNTWQDAWNLVKTTLKTIWDEIVDVSKLGWDTFTGIFKTALDLLNGHWGDAWKDAKETLNNVVSDIGNIFVDLGKDLWNWGANAIKMFADGIKSEVHSVINAVSGVANTVKGYLGFHSPTELGPGSDADTWAPNFINMYVEGLLSGIGKVQNAVSQVIQPFQPALAGNSELGMIYSGGRGLGSSGGGVVIQNTIHVSGNITKNERELGQTVARVLWEQMKSQGKW